MTLVLASASPRRRDILRTLGVSFEARVSDVDERPEAGEAPARLAERLAAAKARAVSEDAPGRLVLGADTVVVRDGEALNKPTDDRDARRMIGSLSGRWHEVVSGVALARDGSAVESLAVVTRVRFRILDDDTVARYVATGEGRDKAGAYAVQGVGAGLVERLEGSYSNVVGLPACETIALLLRHGALERWP